MGLPTPTIYPPRVTNEDLRNYKRLRRRIDSRTEAISEDGCQQRHND